MHRSNKKTSLGARRGRNLLDHLKMIRIAGIVDTHVAFATRDVKPVCSAVILNLIRTQRRWLSTYYSSRIRVHRYDHTGIAANYVQPVLSTVKGNHGVLLSGRNRPRRQHLHRLSIYYSDFVCLGEIDKKARVSIHKCHRFDMIVRKGDGPKEGSSVGIHSFQIGRPHVDILSSGHDVEDITACIVFGGIGSRREVD